MGVVVVVAGAAVGAAAVVVGGRGGVGRGVHAGAGWAAWVAWAAWAARLFWINSPGLSGLPHLQLPCATSSTGFTYTVAKLPPHRSV